MGALGDAGWTSEEGIRQEARRILGAPDLAVSATCVQVPVPTGHSVAVHASFGRPITVEAARRLVEAPAVVVDDPESREFPAHRHRGLGPAFVGRLRQASDFPHAGDVHLRGQLRQGCALNAIRVAELLAAELAEAA